ncbi:hypothetical protein F9C07_10912 [Aspergillus flavus]|uniref:Uncharacterized protein n=1 Tax=Aspergillus flavus (strain ATCC 200026 / FGSC A1120 / IAM 13836 / NRRL 3357 / JCM 12722 / SRRC 167) TaxID=332952 RepID=A0A7U2QXT9_ASPFN|nr:hypothetical protein F9C07_10912 [Aspergillus flavus]
MPRFNNNIILQSLVAAERHQRLTSPPRGRLNVHPCSCTFQLRQSSGKKQGARVSALNAVYDVAQVWNLTLAVHQDIALGVL